MSNKNGGCLSVLFPFLKFFAGEDESSKALPYAKRDDFLSVSELSFYKVLKQVTGEKAVIFTKVGLKEIFFVKSKDRSDFSTHHNKIDRKHVDFLLCNSDNLQPICAIELDDSSHSKSDRIERDLFVDKVFDTAKFPLIRFTNKKSYILGEVAEKLAPYINPTVKVEDKIIENESIEQISATTDNHICPKCGIPMVERTISKGEKKGKKFYGCANYPKCRETVNL